MDIPMNFTNIQCRLGFLVLAGMTSGLLVGKVLPGLALDSVIPFALFIMLFPAMLDIELQKVRQTMANPTLLLISQFLNFILAPILIFFILRLVSLDLSRGLTMGAIIFAVMPCGGMVPAYTSMLNGNVNLAVCTVAFSLLLSIGVVPVSIELLAGESIRTPCLLIARFLAICVVTPIVAAWMLRRYLVAKKGAHIYERVKRSLKTLSGFGLASMVFVVFVSNGKLLSREPSVIPKIVLVASLFFVAQLFCSILFAKAARSSYPDFVAFVISTTANNTALAMALATSYFGYEASLFIAVAGNLVQLPGMLGFLRIFSSTRAAIVQRQ